MERSGALLSSASDIRRTLSLAGWQPSQIVEKAVRIRERQLDVTHGTAHRGGLWGALYVLPDCEDGDEAERLASMMSAPLFASRRMGRTKVQVEVLDGDRALAELEALESEQVLRGTFDDALEGIVRRGWHIEKDRTREDDYEFSWQIRSRAPGEHLALGIR